MRMREVDSMIDIKEYFQSEYEFELVGVEFQADERTDDHGGYRLCVNDEVTAEVKQHTVGVLFTRKVSFDPKGLFDIRVQFKVNLHFAEGVRQEDLQGIDWEKEIKSTRTPFLSNVISRASGIISSLTAYCGQNPIITPPVIIQ